MIEQQIKQVYGSWQVLQRVWVNKKTKEYSNDKTSIDRANHKESFYYECKCLKCNITVRPIQKGCLINGRSKSCLHCSFENRGKKIKTSEKPLLAGATYGLWQVKHRVWRNQKTGECSANRDTIAPQDLQNKPYYECECLSCHLIKGVLKSNLVKGRTKSCQKCIKQQKASISQ